MLRCVLFRKSTVASPYESAEGPALTPEEDLCAVEHAAGMSPVEFADSLLPGRGQAQPEQLRPLLC
jgi:hypothetical protein